MQFTRGMRAPQTSAYRQRPPISRRKRIALMSLSSSGAFCSIDLPMYQGSRRPDRTVGTNVLNSYGVKRSSMPEIRVIAVVPDLPADLDTAMDSFSANWSRLRVSSAAKLMLRDGCYVSSISARKIENHRFPTV